MVDRQRFVRRGDGRVVVLDGDGRLMGRMELLLSGELLLLDARGELVQQIDAELIRRLMNGRAALVACLGSPGRRMRGTRVLGGVMGGAGSAGSRAAKT